MTLPAPYDAATSSFSRDDATAVTEAPSSAPSCTAARPTPPPAPRTTSSSPGCSRATERSTWYAVRWATPKAAACGSSTPAGMRVTASTEIAASSANAPTNPVPLTRSPTTMPLTPSATSVTTPANSLPGMNGVGTGTWYSLATINTSGKLTAAAPTRTRTWPVASAGEDTSSTSTTSGGP